MISNCTVPKVNFFKEGTFEEQKRSIRISRGSEIWERRGQNKQKSLTTDPLRNKKNAESGKLLRSKDENKYSINKSTAELTTYISA